MQTAPAIPYLLSIAAVDRRPLSSVNCGEALDNILLMRTTQCMRVFSVLRLSRALLFGLKRPWLKIGNDETVVRDTKVAPRALADLQCQLF